MKKTALTLTLLLSVGIALSAQAQKIAVVNPMVVLEQSNTGKAMIADFEAAAAEKQKQNVAFQNEINNLRKELSSPALNTETREKKAATLATKETNYKRFVEDSQRELGEKRNKMVQRLSEEVTPIIQEIGKQKGFALVFDLGNAGVAYFDSAIDISSDVIAAYNAKSAAKK